MEPLLPRLAAVGGCEGVVLGTVRADVRAIICLSRIKSSVLHLEDTWSDFHVKL